MKPAFGHFKLNSATRSFRGFILSVPNHPALRWLKNIWFSLSKKINQPIDLVHEGLNLRIYPQSNSQDRWILKVGRHPEQDSRAVFDGFEGKGFVFVDIGANVGFFSLSAAQVAGPTAQIIAIEPHPGTFQKLTENIAFNRAGTIKQLQVGVSDSVGEMLLFEDENEGENSMIAHGDQKNAKSVSVAVKPLLDIVTECGVDRIDILKIDIEGYEDRALKPFFDTAPRSLWPKRIMIEDSCAESWELDLLQHLKELGYGEIGRSRPNVFLGLDAEQA